MVQKAVRSEASSPNSLGPKRDWPEVRGEECRPRTVLSWLLAKWVVGESEEAGRRTLSSHGPKNPEEKEIALSWEQKRKILLPALHQGKERRCSRRLLRKSKFQHLWVARVRAALSTSWTTWGLAGTRGGRRSPARGSTRRPRYRFGLGWSSSGGRRRAPTATGRLRPGPGGSGGWCITPEQVCWIASVCCCTAENCWAKPSTVSPNSPAWEMGASRKRALSTSFISTRLSQRWRSWTTMVERSQSPCAAPASTPGRYYPRAPV